MIDSKSYSVDIVLCFHIFKQKVINEIKISYFREIIMSGSIIREKPVLLGSIRQNSVTSK
jgi:hypothetical protein